MSARRWRPAPAIFSNSGTNSSILLIVRLLDQHLAVADDRVQRRTQLVAHRREEAALGFVGRFGIALGPLEFDLSLLQFGDVGIDGDGAAVGGLAFADANPSVAEPPFADEACRIPVDAQALGHPVLRRLALEVDLPARQASLQDVLEALPRQLASLIVGKDFAIFAVGKKDPVLRIEQDESVRNRLEGGRDRPSLPLRLLFQSLLFNCARPEKPKRARHRAEFVPSLRRDFDIVASFRQFPDDSVQPPQRADDRAKDEDGEKRADQHHDGHQNGSGRRRFLGSVSPPRCARLLPWRSLGRRVCSGRHPHWCCGCAPRRAVRCR